MGFFLAHVWIYMQESGPEIATKGAKGLCMTMVLEEATAEWTVTIHNDDAPELRNFATSWLHFGSVSKTT